MLACQMDGAISPFGVVANQDSGPSVYNRKKQNTTPTGSGKSGGTFEREPTGASPLPILRGSTR